MLPSYRNQSVDMGTLIVKGLMVLQHRNITHTSMITVKGKKPSQLMF